MIQENAVKEKFSWEALFSASCARMFFLLLLFLDVLWFMFACLKLGIYLVLEVIFLGTSLMLHKRLQMSWLSIKRAVICALALVVALFSPAFGILIGCTYFLMYDKPGIEEVIHLSIREQFKEVFTELQPPENI